MKHNFGSHYSYIRRDLQGNSPHIFESKGLYTNSFQQPKDMLKYNSYYQHLQKYFDLPDISLHIDVKNHQHKYKG